MPGAPLPAVILVAGIGITLLHPHIQQSCSHSQTSTARPAAKLISRRNTHEEVNTEDRRREVTFFLDAQDVNFVSK
jgi:hypothetical protein